MTQIRITLEGEMTIGDQLCRAGTVHVVENKTTYGPLVAGPEGVKFLLVSDVDPSTEEYEPIAA